MKPGVVPSTALALTAMLATACAVNPATGNRQLSLIGESQEIRLGTDADKEISGQMGVYQAPMLSKTVTEMGMRLAANSERPDLPWSFKIVDEPVVNAFALPGGYIYVTRGILAYMNSHGELAAVLGHEIGHVTARHSVNQMSKAQLTGIGLNLGAALDDRVARYANLTGTGFGLLFLKFGRDDERQADDLGLRYMRRTGQSGAAMMEMFRMLGAVSGGGSSPVPGWLSTHPNPANREERIRDQLPGVPTTLPADDAWLRLLEGVVFSDDPRQGFFRENRFLHPQMAFRFDFPQGWETANARQSVSARQADGKAIIQITLVSQASPAAAAAQFFDPADIQRGGSWRNSISGLPTISASFRAGSGSEALAGLVAFVSHGGNVFRLLGVSSATDWQAQQEGVGPALASFARLTEARDLNVKPYRLTLTAAGTSSTLAAFHRAHPSTVSLETIARLNHLQPEARVSRGMLIKRVIGGP